MSRLALPKLAAVLAILVMLAAPGAALATEPITIDCVYTDWSGELNIADGSGDASANGDIVAFYFANNDNVNSNFYMIERVAPNPKTNVTYLIYIDTNNNGNYGETADRQVQVDYTPQPGNTCSGSVAITVKNGGGTTVASYTGLSGGEPKGGQNKAAKVELEVTFADLGISAYQTIRHYATSVTEGDRAPDSGDIQWSPVPVLGYGLLALVVLGGGLIIWWRKGRYVWKTP